MKILVTNRGGGHLTYRKMSQKPVEAFKRMGHDAYSAPVADIGQDLTIILGYSTNWDQVKNLPGKKIWWCHGANWSTHSNFKNENKQVWDLIRNCDAVAYQSEFAKHMAQKFLEFNREGPIILNAAKAEFTNHSQRPEPIVNIATAAVWRDWKRLKDTELIIDKLNEGSEWTKYHLWVYGRDPAEKNYGNPNFNHYLGLSNDFFKYDDCHFYIQISFNDFSPATVGEAMAKGLPILCGNSGGSPDIVGDAGIILDIDPYIDYSMNCYRDLPKIDYQTVITGILTMCNSLDGFRQRVKNRVMSVANSDVSAKQLLDLV